MCTSTPGSSQDSMRRTSQETGMLIPRMPSSWKTAMSSLNLGNFIIHFRFNENNHKNYLDKMNVIQYINHKNHRHLIIQPPHSPIRPPNLFPHCQNFHPASAALNDWKIMMVNIKINYIYTWFLFLSWMYDESPWMSLI